MHSDGPHRGATCVAIDGCAFDLLRGELHDRAGRRVALRPQSLAVLQCLAREADRLVSRDELMRAVWPGVVATDDSLAQCIKEIRHALHDGEHRIPEARLVAFDSANHAPLQGEPAFDHAYGLIDEFLAEDAAAAASPPLRDAAAARAPLHLVAAARPDTAKRRR